MVPDNLYPLKILDLPAPLGHPSQDTFTPAVIAHVQVRVPEGPPTQHERLAALEAFEAMSEELTKEQWDVFEEAVQRRPWFGGRQLDL